MESSGSEAAPMHEANKSSMPTCMHGPPVLSLEVKLLEHHFEWLNRLGDEIDHCGPSLNQFMAVLELEHIRVTDELQPLHSVSSSDKPTVLRII